MGVVAETGQTRSGEIDGSRGCDVRERKRIAADAGTEVKDLPAGREYLCEAPRFMAGNGGVRGLLKRLRNSVNKTIGKSGELLTSFRLKLRQSKSSMDGSLGKKVAKFLNLSDCGRRIVGKPGQERSTVVGVEKVESCGSDIRVIGRINAHECHDSVEAQGLGGAVPGFLM